MWDLTLACQGPLQHCLHVPKACLQIPVHDAHCCQRKGCSSHSQIQPLVVWLVQLIFQSATLRANRTAINRLILRESPVGDTMVPHSEVACMKGRVLQNAGCTRGPKVMWGLNQDCRDVLMSLTARMLKVMDVAK